MGAVPDFYATIEACAYIGGIDPEWMQANPYWRNRILAVMSAKSQAQVTLNKKQTGRKSY